MTSAKIRSSTITSADVRNNSLLRARLQARPAPAGPAGPQGPAGVSGREQVSAESPQSSAAPKNVTVTCPTGKVVIGGGVERQRAGPRARHRDREQAVRRQRVGGARRSRPSRTPAAWKVIVHALCATVAT